MKTIIVYFNFLEGENLAPFKLANCKTATKKLFFNIFVYMFFITAGYVVLYPFLYILIGSFKGASDFYDPTVTWIPKYATIENLRAALVVLDYGKTLLITIIYQLIPALLQFGICALPAYGLARFKFRLKPILVALLFINMLVPVTMVVIPTYVNYKQLDLFGILGFLSSNTGVDIRPDILDTPFAFLLPSIFGVGLNGGLFIYIYMQFFKGLPKELEEAAYIDGAGPIRTFISIVIPSSGSSAIIVLMFSVIWNWCDYYLPQMYLSENYPMSTSLNQLSNKIGIIIAGAIGETTASTQGILIASCLLFLIPLVIFYCLLQDKFSKSIANTGLVG